MQSNLARATTGYAERQKQTLLDIARAAIREASQRLIERTPVKTGRARSNYFFGLNAMPTETTDEADPAGEPSRQRIDAGLGAMRLGDRAFVVNSLDYIIPLEFGHSQQAPAGMMRVTAREWRAILRMVTGR